MSRGPLVLTCMACMACSACGRVGFGPLPPGDIGAAADGPDGDAACGSPTLSLPSPPPAPFGAPTAITELNAAQGSDDPSLTADMLEIFFDSVRGGTPRIWQAQRATTAALWSAPVPVLALDGLTANTPEVSRDGLTLYFSAPRGGTGPAAPYAITRADRMSAWSSPRELAELTGSGEVTGIATFFDGQAVVYYSSASGGPGGGDLWQAFLTTDCMSFGSAAPLPGQANTSGTEANAWMRNDGLVVAFASLRLGATGNGDLWISQRSSLTVGFDPAVEQVALDSGAADDDPWLNDAMTEVYFMSVRTGTASLYVAKR